MTRQSKDRVDGIACLLVIALSIVGGSMTEVSWWVWAIAAVVLISAMHLINVNVWYTQKEKAEFKKEQKRRSEVPSNITDLLAMKGTKAGEQITLFEPSDMQRPTIGRRTVDCFRAARVRHLTLSTVRDLIEREVKEGRFDQFDIELLTKAAVDFPRTHCRDWVALDATNGAFAYGVYDILGSQCYFGLDAYEGLTLDILEPAKRNVRTVKELTKIKGSHFASLLGADFSWDDAIPNVDINSVTCAVIIREMLRCKGRC